MLIITIPMFHCIFCLYLYLFLNVDTGQYQKTCNKKININTEYIQDKTIF